MKDSVGLHPAFLFLQSGGGRQRAPSAEWKAESLCSLPLDLTPELNLIVMGRGRRGGGRRVGL